MQVSSLSLDTGPGINPKVLLSFTSSEKEVECRRLLETFNSREKRREEKFFIVKKETKKRGGFD